jgi:CBS domain-containing protein
MATVRQILSGKKSLQVHTIAPERTTYEALQIMARHDLGCVAVIEAGKLVGLLTEREYARRIVLEGKKSRNTPVRDTMLKKFLVVDPDQTVEDCMALMTDHHIRYLPVIEEGRFVGIISIGDIVKTVIAQQARSLEHLERYISGGEYGMA